MRNEDVATKPELDSLLDKNLDNLIQGLAHKYFWRHGKNQSTSIVSQKDLVSEGYLGAIVAYESFDTAFNTKFSTHAYPYIVNAMSAYCRKFGHPLSISEKSARTDLEALSGIKTTHIDQLEEFDVPSSGMELPPEIDKELLLGLSQLESDLLLDHVVMGYSLAELGQIYKMSKSRAGEMIRSSKQRIRERIKNYEDYC